MTLDTRTHECCVSILEWKKTVAQSDEWEEHLWTRDSKNIANTQGTTQWPVGWVKKYLINSKAVLLHSAPGSKTSPIIWWRTEKQSHIPQHFPL